MKSHVFQFFFEILDRFVELSSFFFESFEFCFELMDPFFKLLFFSFSSHSEDSNKNDNHTDQDQDIYQRRSQEWKLDLQKKEGAYLGKIR